MARVLRILLTKPTHDCHDRGVRLLARRFSDAGCEVIFTNFLLPAEIVSTALQEAVDAIGVSSSSGGHMPVFEDLVSGLSAAGAGDVVIIGGGVIPSEDVAILAGWGVEVFTPGASPASILERIRERVDQS